MRITSPAFADGEAIPARYTCEGRDTSPPLRFEQIPGGTRSLALIVDDPDAPDPAAPRRTWVHWLVFNLSPESAGLAEGTVALPEGVCQGRNDWNRARYGGPCPPIGRHRYFHKLYALDRMLDLHEPTKSELEAAMQGHILAQAQLVGTYQKAATRQPHR